ncbi:unnamed protein product [Brassica rapa]|uniref:Uncharacterized protein n=1 Tax=Brassica campestris TaxID=3711 RepID=A0A3P6BLU2_BRACM|nr:unnamed protein product [Brassica rapa]VDD03446.1 unnamed protein product [Brassica rapa]
MLSNRISISSPSQIQPCVFVLLLGPEEEDSSCVVDIFVCCLCNSLYHCPFLSQLYFKRQK